MIVKKFTEEYRQEVLREHKESLFTFCLHGLGMENFSSDLHFRLCETLQGRGSWGPDWLRGVVTMFRGSYKSSAISVGYALHCGLFPENLGLVDHSTRVLGASYTNVQANSVEKARNLFLAGDRSGELQWLYKHRLPENFDGWTEDTVKFLTHNPLSFPALTCKGMTAKQESYHGNLIIFDDPEGADAEKGTVGNEDARRSIANAAPLLIRPDRDRVIVIGTPWGHDPTIYRLLREDLSDKPPDRSQPIEWNNSKRVWKQFYTPVVDGSGKSAFPEIVTPRTLQVLRTGDKRMWNSQYLLLEGEDGQSIFGNQNIDLGLYEKVETGIKGIRYPALSVDDAKWKKSLSYEEKLVWRFVAYDELKYYLHADLIHREDTVTHKHTGTARPSRAAIVIVGVAPDGHAFVLDYWNWPMPGDVPTGGETAINVQVRQAYRLHMLYGCSKATWDSIGAQVWFRQFCENLERTNPAYRQLKSSGRYGPTRMLPPLSHLMVEDKRSPRMHKEQAIFERLGAPIQEIRLHFREDQDEMLRQVKNLESTDYVDLVDALAQGPPVWQGGLSSKAFARYQFQEQQRKSLRSRYTGFHSPYRDKALKQPKLEDPEGEWFDVKVRLN